MIIIIISRVVCITVMTGIGVAASTQAAEVSSTDHGFLSLG